MSRAGHAFDMLADPSNVIDDIAQRVPAPKEWHAGKPQIDEREHSPHLKACTPAKLGGSTHRAARREDIVH